MAGLFSIVLFSDVKLITGRGLFQALNYLKFLTVLLKIHRYFYLSDAADPA